MRPSYSNQLSDSHHASILLKPIGNKMCRERYSYFFLIKSKVKRMQGEFFPILLQQLKKNACLKNKKTQRIEPKDRKKPDSFII